MDREASRKAFKDDYFEFSAVKRPQRMDLNLTENKHGINNPVEDLKQETEGLTTTFTIGSNTFTFKDGLLVDVTGVSVSPSVSPSVSLSPSLSPSVSPSASPS